jgi:DNA (cytosine-5)-methyltransferase 1
MKPSWTAIDLFSGCGGLTAGLKKAGFEVVTAVEKEKLTAKTYAVNHDEVKLFTKDIRKIVSADFLPPNQKTVDLVAGCPPCQGFSRVRRRNRSRARPDKRNGLLREFQRVVEDLRPTCVFMENVPGIELDFRFKAFVVKLEKLGYQVTMEIVNLADYGVPQRRTRVVLLAGKGFGIALPRPSRKSRTVREAIKSLERPSESKNPLHKLITTHTAEVMERIRAVPKNGGSRSSWPEDLRLECHNACNGFKDVYGRMAWDEPAPTITGGCTNASKGRFLHPRQNRVITLFEAAILQTFPRRFHFDLSRGRGAVAEMIGNALPPLFAARVGAAIVKALDAHRNG